MKMITKGVAAALAMLAIVPGLWSSAQTVTTAAPHEGAGAMRQEQCTNRALWGRYGFDIQGTQFAPPPATPAASVGIVEFDGRGGLTGSDVASFAGQIVPRTFKGSYTVNPNCTASASLTIQTGFPVGATFSFAVVLFDHGREARFIQTTPGSLFTGTLKQQ